MKKNIKTAVVFLIAAALIAGTAIVTTSITKQSQNNNSRTFSRNNQQQQIQNVETKSESITKTIIVDGIVDFNKKVKYFSTEDGKTAIKINVKIGDSVRPGNRIIEFDSERLSALSDQLKNEELSLASLKIDISKLKTVDSIKTMQLQNDITSLRQQITEYEINIKNNENQISQAGSTLNSLNDDLKLKKELFAKGYSSQTEIKNIEDKIMESKNSISKFNTDNENFKNMIDIKNKLIASTDKQIDVETNKEKDPGISLQIQSKQHEIAKNELKISQINKEMSDFKRYLTADFTGVITNIYVEAGQNIVKGKELVEVSDNNDIIINANISEFDINKITVGDTAKVTGDALDKEYSAYISRINPIAKTDSNGNTIIPIELRFENGGKNIRNNYKVNLEITKKPVGKSLMVPLSAIIRDENGKSYVMVVSSSNEKSKTADVNSRTNRAKRQNTTGSTALPQENSTQKQSENNSSKYKLTDAATGNTTYSTARPQKIEITTGEIKGNMVEIIGLSPADKVVTVSKTGNNQRNRTFIQNLTGRGGGQPQFGPGGGR